MWIVRFNNEEKEIINVYKYNSLHLNTSALMACLSASVDSIISMKNHSACFNIRFSRYTSFLTGFIIIPPCNDPICCDHISVIRDSDTVFKRVINSVATWASLSDANMFKFNLAFTIAWNFMRLPSNPDYCRKCIWVLNHLTPQKLITQPPQKKSRHK